MALKRRNTSSPELDSPLPGKRLESPASSGSDDEYWESKTRPQVDVWTGQTCAFPGLEVDGDDLPSGTPNDGIEYLRMVSLYKIVTNDNVRSEARNVPALLVTSLKSDTYQKETAGNDEDTEVGGFYDDGAYVAESYSKDGEEKKLSVAQQLYYTSLITQFQLLRATMNCIPPLVKIEEQEKQRLTAFLPESKSAREEWEVELLERTPHPAQVASMTSDTVLEIIKFLRRRLVHWLTTSDDGRIKTLSSWIWAILAKCRDMGELGSEEVGELREFAKRAIGMSTKTQQHQQLKTTSQAAKSSGHDNGKEVLGYESDNPVNLERLPTEVSLCAVDLETMKNVSHIEVLLDMIVTVIGEFYGQKDLLDCRHVW